MVQKKHTAVTKPLKTAQSAKRPLRTVTKSKATAIQKKTIKPAPAQKAKTTKTIARTSAKKIVKAKPVARKPSKKIDKPIAKKKPVAAIKTKAKTIAKKKPAPKAVKKALTKKPIAKIKTPVKKKTQSKTATLKKNTAVKTIVKKQTKPLKATPKNKPAPKKQAPKTTKTTTRITKKIPAKKLAKAVVATKAKQKIVIGKIKTAAEKKPMAQPLVQPKILIPKTSNAKLEASMTQTKNNTAEMKKSLFTINPNYMNPKNLTHYRTLLNEWKAHLMVGVDKTIHHMQDEAANFADPNDRATQEEEFSLELRTRDRERKLMAKIDEAIERIDAGDYGYCTECGIEIGLERLNARPTATLCIDCKTLDEIREKQVAG